MPDIWSDLGAFALIWGAAMLIIILVEITSGR